MSNNKPQQCSTITPITLPADDTDRMHSMHAALSSLDAMASSFDTSMDSILQTTSNHRQRVKDLESRIAEFRELLSRLDDLAKSKMNEGESVDDKICMVFSPNSYESALEGMESELAMIRDEISTSTLCRSAANDAVMKSIQKDIDNDDGQALPSDSWLDQMDNGVVEALKQSNDQRSIPMLSGDDSVRKGEEEYQYVLDKLLNSSDKSTASRLGSGAIQKGDDESISSVTSQLSAISVTSNSTRMTAGQRKRHKQQMQQMQNTTKSSTTQMSMQPTLSPHLEEEQTSTTIAGRQQAIAGSSPYLCDNLHDSYGIGTEPSKGLIDCSGFSARGTKEGGTSFYPPSSHVSDLYVFNTTKKSYGVTKKSST